MEEEKTNTSVEKPKCDQCGKEFDNISGVKMHKLRMHGPGWDTSDNFHHLRRAKTREEVLQWKRDYNKRYRERLRAKGLSSRDNLGMQERTQKKGRKIQYVYPDPEQQKAEEAMEKVAELEQVQIPTLTHCPYCGGHVGGWKYQP